MDVDTLDPPPGPECASDRVSGTPFKPFFGLSGKKMVQMSGKISLNNCETVM
jgi:hypothetical protein